jgi:hypothetical protein
LEKVTRRRAITLRSVMLGLLGVMSIALITPYSDYALKNSAFIGFNLPVGVVMLFFLFAVFVNGPLSKWKPAWSFSSGEMAMMLAMMLAACAVPSSGLMRYFPASLIMPFAQGGSSPDHVKMWSEMKLARWLFPTFASDSPRDWGGDPLVTGYHLRWSGDTAPPYVKWITPAIYWGVFFGGLWAALLCLASLVHRQWFENERLAFPLAQIQLGLVEQPEAGRWFNGLFNKRTFWIGFAAVFFIRFWNGMHVYWPTYVPEIPTGYNLTAMFSEAPLSYASPYVRRAEIWFAVIGVAFFLSNSVSLSLWAFPIGVAVFCMGKGVVTGEPGIKGEWDQHLGSAIAFLATIVWIGRKHFALIFRQAFRGAREGEPEGRYMSYAASFWLLMAAAGLMIGWLWLAGASVIGATVIVLLLLILFMLITRVVAETGLIYGQLLVPIYKPWQLIAHYTGSKPVGMETFYLSSLMQVSSYDFREPFPVYATHGMKVADQAVFEGGDNPKRERSTGRSILLLMFLAVAISYTLSFSSMLWTEYRFSETQDQTPTAPVNSWGTTGAQRNYVTQPSQSYFRTTKSNLQYDPLTQMGVGAGITAALAALRLRFAWWPLHPIGFLMYPTTPAQVIWFSLFLGWLVKVLTLKFGGASMYQKAKPLAVGIIVGECVAAGAWMAISLLLHWLGVSYKAIDLMAIT